MKGKGARAAVNFGSADVRYFDTFTSGTHGRWTRVDFCHTRGFLPHTCDICNGSWDFRLFNARITCDNCRGSSEISCYTIV